MTSTTALSDVIGVGLYSPAEAARYARVRSAKLSRWLYGTSAAEPVISPQIGEVDGERIVTFLDFAQTLSINEIRLTAKIPLGRIKEAYRNAQSDYGVKYPFAVEHGVFVFGDLKRPDKCQLGIFIPGTEKPGDFVKRAFQLTGKLRKQQLIWKVVQSFSVHLSFDDSGVASQYTAMKSHGFTVVMNPDVRFGKPYLEEVGYEAATLAEASEIEGGVKRAARLYRVEEGAVRAAIDYYKLLNTPVKPSPPEPLAA